MAHASTALPPSLQTIDDQSNVLDAHLHQLQHVCQFIADLAIAGSSKQVDTLQAETVGVVFEFLSDQMRAARDEAGNLRKAAFAAVKQ